MEYNNSQFLESEGIQIAMFLEGKDMEEHPVYYPYNVLCYIEQGTFHVRVNDKIRSISEGNFILVKKYTHASCFKTWEDHQSGFKFLAMLLQDEFIKEFMQDVKVPKTTSDFPQTIIVLPQSTILKGLMQSFSSYFDGNLKMDKPLAKLKTQEAFIGMMEAKPELIHIFKEFSTPGKAELTQFMEHHITNNITLPELAKLSGRSLSTFNREFKKLFNASPHQWIKKERLEMAKRIMMETDRRPSDIYLEIGFEDLAHFSKSFKKYFGINPSQFPQSN